MRLELPPRESLRLRARWLDELAARAAWSLGGRLAASGRIGSPIEIRELTLAELTSVLEGEPVPPDLRERCDEPGPPLPAAFRMTASGTVVAASPRGGRTRRSPSQGRGAGGGRGAGRVTHEGAAVRPGDVLVVRVLSPALAPLLHGLAGLVSETGSELSHLAILAREAGVPTVVGMEDAMALLPEGSDAVVDGTTGEVRVEDRTEASNGLTGEVAG